MALVERGEPAGETSSHCDGDVLLIDHEPGYDSQLARSSQARLAEWVGELELEFDYRAPGSIMVCESETELAAAREWVERQQAAGLPFRLLDRADLRAESRYLSPHLLGGLECATDALVNPALLTYALWEGARALGARTLPFTPVRGIRLDGGRVAAVQTLTGEIRTPRVVVAAGVWTPQLTAPLGLDLPIRPRKGHVLVTQRGRMLAERNIMEFGYMIGKFGREREVDPETAELGVAFVLEPTGAQNHLLGSSRQFVDLNRQIDPRVVRTSARRAVRFMPALAEVATIRSYVGFRPWTPDHLPVVGPAPGIQGLYVAAGHEGNGIGLAAVTGRLIAELVTGKEPHLPVAPLDPGRFGQGHQVWNH